MADLLNRSYLVVDRPGPATSDRMADLFETAAAALRSHGHLTVHHLVFETTDDTTAADLSLTVYYDRVERRQHDRG